MNAILNFCCLLSVVCLFSLVAGNIRGQDPIADQANAEMVGRPTKIRPVMFNSHARAKAVQYFDTYRAEPYGLPPACVAVKNPMEFPLRMDEVRIKTGEVVKENERTCLLDAPDDLTRVFPVQPEGFRYCIAGNQLVIVDDRCRVLDAIRIPTIQPSLAGQGLHAVNFASHQF